MQAIHAWSDEDGEAYEAHVHAVVRSDLAAAGFDDLNRTHLNFEDFDGGASGFLGRYGGFVPCTATLD